MAHQLGQGEKKQGEATIRNCPGRSQRSFVATAWKTIRSPLRSTRLAPPEVIAKLHRRK